MPSGASSTPETVLPLTTEGLSDEFLLDEQTITKIKIESGLCCRFKDRSPDEERELPGRVTGRCDSEESPLFSDG